MTVQELINILDKIGDKNLEIKVENPDGMDSLEIRYVSISPYEILINLFT